MPNFIAWGRNIQYCSLENRHLRSSARSSRAKTTAEIQKGRLGWRRDAQPRLIQIKRRGKKKKAGWQKTKTKAGSQTFVWKPVRSRLQRVRKEQLKTTAANGYGFGNQNVFVKKKKLYFQFYCHFQRERSRSDGMSFCRSILLVLHLSY